MVSNYAMHFILLWLLFEITHGCKCNGTDSCVESWAVTDIKIQGSLPHNLQIFKKQDLSYYNFTGDLSSSFGSLSNLSRLNIQQNLFSGILREHFQTIPKLWIQGNKFYQLSNSPPTTQANGDENFVPNKVRKHKKYPTGRGRIAFMVGGGALLATGFTVFMAIYLNKLQRLRSFQGNYNSLLFHHITAAEEVFSTALNENLEIQPFNATLGIALHSAAYKALLGGLQLKMSLGVAQVLNYLNSTFSSAVAHCNLKAANILLDEILKPRVCDIGLAILKPNRLKFRGSKIAITDTWHTSPNDDDQGFHRRTNNAERSGTATPRKKALLLGMNYPDVEDITLQYCRAECLSLTEILMNNFDFAEEDVKILCDMEEDYAEPTKDEITRQLEWLLQNEGAANVLFLYIACHAYIAGDSNKPAMVTSPDYNIMTKKFCSDIIERVPLGATLTVFVSTCLGGYFFKEAKESSERRGEVIVYTACDEFGGTKDGDFYFGIMKKILKQQETKEITNEQLYQRFKAAGERGVKLYSWEVREFYKTLQFYCSEVKIGARFLGF